MDHLYSTAGPNSQILFERVLAAGTVDVERLLKQIEIAMQALRLSAAVLLWFERALSEALENHAPGRQNGAAICIRIIFLSGGAAADQDWGMFLIQKAEGKTGNPQVRPTQTVEVYLYRDR